MNLELHLKENPTKTLTDVQAHSIPLDKVYNSNEMAIILAFNTLYLYFKEHGGEFQTAFYDRVRTQSNYDFRSTEPDGLALQGMLDIIIATESDEVHKANLVNLKQTVLNSADGVLYPYVDLTQVEFDKAKTLASLKATPTVIETSYVTDDYIINKYRSKALVTVTITEPLAFADTIIFNAASGNTKIVDELPQTDYATDTRQRASILVPANFTGTLSTEINLSALLTKVKVYATSKFDRGFTASIANAVG